MANPPFSPSATTPPLAWSTITWSDSTDLARQAFAIRSSTAGSIKVTHVDGTTSVMNFTAGETRPCQVVRVWENGGATIATADLEVAFQLYA